jgi:hypothetical protein
MYVLPEMMVKMSERSGNRFGCKVRQNENFRGDVKETNLRFRSIVQLMVALLGSVLESHTLA